MTPFKDMKTELLENILAAYTASYGRELTDEEKIDNPETIEQINFELKLRRERGEKKIVKKQDPIFWRGWF